MKRFSYYWLWIYVEFCGPQENPDPPTTKLTITTGQIIGITATTATCSENNVTADGGATVTIRGVCWSTASNPTIEDSKQKIV